MRAPNCLPLPLWQLCHVGWTLGHEGMSSSFLARISQKVLHTGIPGREGSREGCMIVQAALKELLGCNGLVLEGKVELLLLGSFNAPLLHWPDVLRPQLLNYPLHVYRQPIGAPS